MSPRSLPTRSVADALGDALRRFTATTACPAYLRVAAEAWLRATGRWST